MSQRSDKHWTRADGVTLHLYGAGSMARVYDEAGGNLIIEADLQTAVDEVRLPAA